MKKEREKEKREEKEGGKEEKEGRKEERGEDRHTQINISFQLRRKKEKNKFTQDYILEPGDITIDLITINSKLMYTGKPDNLD